MANEIALVMVFILGWLLFRVDRSPKPDFKEKEMHANYSAGQYALVVEQALQLRRPSEDALRVTVSALLESEPDRIPDVVQRMAAKSRLCLSAVWEVAFLSTVTASVLDALVRAMDAVSRPDPCDFYRALSERGVPATELAARFGLQVDVHAEQPLELLAAYEAAPDAALFAHTMEALARTGPEQAVALARHATARAAPREELLRLLRTLPLSLALALVQGARLQGTDAFKALSRFGHLEAVQALRGDAKAVLGMLKECAEPARAAQLLARLRDPSNRTCNMALAAAKSVPVARALFKGTAGKRDVVTYNTMLKAQVTASEWSSVSPLLAQMKAEGIAANHVTYNTLLHACVAQRSSPWPFVASMEKQGLAPDAFTITSLLSTITAADATYLRRCLAYCGSVRVDGGLVERLLEAAAVVGDPELAQRADEVAVAAAPAVRVFLARIKWAPLEAKERAWEALRASGLPVGDHEFSHMAAALLAAGATDRARALLEEAQEAVAHPTGVYIALVKGFAQRKELGAALATLEGMRTHGEAVPLMLFNSLLDACARCGDMFQAMALWEQMPELGVEPDLISFSTLIKGYCVKGELPHALTLFGQLRRRGLRPDAVLFHSILDCCATKQMTDLAEQVYRDMQEEGHKPTSITLSILVKLYGRLDLDRAFAIFEELPAENGFTPNAQTFTCLMSAALSHGAVERALGVKQRMEAARQVPDAKVYQTLVSGCMRQQRLDDAVKLAREAASRRAMRPTLLGDLKFLVDRHRPDLAEGLRGLSA